RFAGVAGFGYAQIVPRGGLRAFAARVDADPPGDDGRRFRLFPPGDRPSYCFSRLAVAGADGDGTALALGVPGLDLCALTDELAQSRDSGRFGAIVLASRGHDMFEMIAPV